MIERLPDGSSLSAKLEAYSIPEPNSGCWLWLGTTSNGYGRIDHGGKTLRAHRASYEEFVGPIPKGFCVLHRCDTPCCVNPEHLFLGTQQDNMSDKAAKRSRRHPARGDPPAHESYKRYCIANSGIFKNGCALAGFDRRNVWCWAGLYLLYKLWENLGAHNWCNKSSSSQIEKPPNILKGGL